MTYLSQEQLNFWDDNGFLLLSGHLKPTQVREIEQWTQTLSDLPETPGKWMKYFERSSSDRAKRLLCRVENFIPYHPGFEAFLSDDVKIGILSELMREKAVLFKEKINFKLPGGAGFKHHQDAPAFTTFNQHYHITMMVAVDPSTVENGCLEVLPGRHREGILPQDADGTLRQDLIDAADWVPVVMQPGDILLFDSYLPHGSAPNRSAAARRALYVTYNRESEGSRRTEYFEHKRATFPPECERVQGVDYLKNAGVYNLGNPID